MRRFLVKLKSLSIVTIVASLLIGVFCIISPAEMVKYFSILLGTAIALMGAFSLVQYFVKDRSSTFFAVLGGVGIITGVIICVRYKSIIQVMLFLIGMFILISGVVDFFASLQALKYHITAWIPSMALAVITTAIGVVVAVNPFNSMEALVRLIGVGLIAYAIMDSIAFFQVKKVSDIVEDIKNSVTGKIDNTTDTSFDEVDSSASEVE